MKSEQNSDNDSITGPGPHTHTSLVAWSSLHFASQKNYMNKINEKNNF